MKATFSEYQKSHPDIHMSWATRSLKNFENYPIEKLAEEYDLILLDHPCLGRAVETGSIIPLGKWLPKEFMLDLKENSVGLSYESYLWNKQLWALPVDTAAQVAAYRADLLNEVGLVIPHTWEDLFRFVNKLPSNLKIGFPLSQTHAVCSFLSICANISENKMWDEVRDIEPEVAVKSLQVLKKLFPHVHTSSLNSDPIEMLERMGELDEVIYTPLIFGYVNYSYDNFKKHVIHFTNIPSFKTEPIGSTIGGVGLGISSKCKKKESALDFARYVTSGEIQRELYVDNHGQPAHRLAWSDSNVNRNSNNFFKNTLRTLDLASIRPRYNGYVEFQDIAGHFIQQYLCDELTVKRTVQKINRLYRKSHEAIN